MKDCIKYSLLPTPLHRLNNLSKLLNANIYCKRDDLTGFGFGGNKTRKLDYLAGEAKREGCDSLLCVGAVHSNFCRIASAYGNACGLDMYFVLGGKKPEKPTGNFLVIESSGANLTFIDSDKWDDWEEASAELESNLIQQGRKPYRMPVGGSNTTGLLGYYNAFNEIREDTERLGVKFDCIFHASGSGGTQAGLVAGKINSYYKPDIIGISVSKKAEDLKTDIFMLLTQVQSSMFGNETPEVKEILVDDKYIGECYGAMTDGCKEAFDLFAKHEGIMLDYVYTAKAAAGMIDYIRKGKIEKDGNVLFIHTGGNIHLFK